ncbi:hypothetical protein PsorP6_016004 [Peronosclerospora sorghi]|uniref:Uncharacterized protein n=1 Tax=Peronosclerospora sorghi TaxID=230839 RepID=A0ACC0WMR5_9STRA|nr:hypothetical protein PsorP6_016004 [Peronosclerospora sorghi]
MGRLQSSHNSFRTAFRAIRGSSSIPSASESTVGLSETSECSPVLTSRSESKYHVSRSRMRASPRAMDDDGRDENDRHEGLSKVTSSEREGSKGVESRSPMKLLWYIECIFEWTHISWQ